MGTKSGTKVRNASLVVFGSVGVWCVSISRKRTAVMPRLELGGPRSESAWYIPGGSSKVLCWMVGGVSFKS